MEKKCMYHAIYYRHILLLFVARPNYIYGYIWVMMTTIIIVCEHGTCNWGYDYLMHNTRKEVVDFFHSHNTRYMHGDVLKGVRESIGVCLSKKFHVFGLQKYPLQNIPTEKTKEKSKGNGPGNMAQSFESLLYATPQSNGLLKKIKLILTTFTRFIY